jgi:hypothetical protein
MLNLLILLSDHVGVTIHCRGQNFLLMLSNKTNVFLKIQLIKIQFIVCTITRFDARQANFLFSLQLNFLQLNFVFCSYKYI